jgi:hypothetical protein
MDFIVGLLLMERRHESIFVLEDTLTKSAHFILVRMTFQVPDIARFVYQRYCEISWHA